MSALDDAVRREVAEDFPEDGGPVVVSSWLMVASVELASGTDTVYGLFSSPGMRRHESIGLLQVAREVLE